MACICHRQRFYCSSCFTELYSKGCCACKSVSKWHLGKKSLSCGCLLRLRWIQVVVLLCKMLSLSRILMLLSTAGNNDNTAILSPAQRDLLSRTARGFIWQEIFFIYEYFEVERGNHSPFSCVSASIMALVWLA
ncbi:hypothetical protein L915_11097 [Phytophthora nicotianae]|uniref:Uncharacterized protein n=2 Tax=Phytophthora nicotianae TaxID=4792 RepID=W2GLA2_PHYNI|nr:hypothetical protein L915_11097 [Phytophthora nicotianae]ETO72491.1 hypothetical protein F444_11477 [Phytophthora nicotianae P1976]